MAAARKQEDRDPVAEAAQVALKTAKGDARKATEVMVAMVRQDQALRDALTEPLIASACYTAVSALCRRERRVIWTPPPPRTTAITPHARVVHLAEGNLLMFRLPGGTPLRDATREEIAAAAEFYSKQAGDMAHKARWLQLIGQAIPSDRRVGDVLTDARLRELQMEAERDD